jgi:transposase
LGAARVQLGSELQAGIVDFNKVAGLSYGKIQRALQSLFGITIARSTACRVVLRAGTRLKPVYEEIKSLVAKADQVGPDETGWRVGGEKAWLHTLATQAVVLYTVAASRGGEVAEAVLGLEYSGRLIHDGWAPYDRFEQADHQQCLNHLLGRCKELLETATRGAVRFPRQVQGLLEKGLETRDRYMAGQMSDHGLAVACGRLEAGLAAVLCWPKSNPDNERLAAFLRIHEEQVFTFVRIPGTDATNWRAEQAIRVAVVNRKVWGGNRTARGAQAQSVLMSVAQTCIRRGGDAIRFVSRWLRGERAILPTMARGP